MPFANKLDEELGRLRRDVYNYMLQHDPAWTRGVEAHIRQEKGGGGIGEASLMNKVEAGIFARVIQDVEDACLDKSRRVLRSSGWTARSWQQDGLLVEGEVGIEASKEQLEGAMRKAEAAVTAGVTVGGQMVAGLEIEGYGQRALDSGGGGGGETAHHRQGEDESRGDCGHDGRVPGAEPAVRGERSEQDERAGVLEPIPSAEDAAAAA